MKIVEMLIFYPIILLLDVALFSCKDFWESHIVGVVIMCIWMIFLNLLFFALPFFESSDL